MAYRSRIARTVLGSGLRYAKRVRSIQSGNIVSQWPMNETSGSTAYDVVGGNDGSYEGVDLGAAKLEGEPAPYFDGANDYVDISAIASNEIANGGFETAGGGGANVHASWTENAGDGAIANETVEIHTGADALKLTAGASADTYDDQSITVVPGEVRKLRFWSQGDGTNAGRYSIYDVSNSADIVALKSTGVTGAAFSMVGEQYTVPAGCTSVRIRVQCPSTDTGVAYFDTVLDRNINSFDPHEGWVHGFVKVPASAWTDGSFRNIYQMYADNDNRIRAYKHSDNNKVAFRYAANGVSKEVLLTPYSETEWFSFLATWSLSNDAFDVYNAGSQIGTFSSLGVFVGQIQAFLMSINTTPTWPFLGNSGVFTLGNAYMPQAEAEYLTGLV